MLQKTTGYSKQRRWETYPKILYLKMIEPVNRLPSSNLVL